MTICLSGLAVHFKLYPIIYTLPFFLATSDKKNVFSNLLDLFNAGRLRFILGFTAALTATCSLCYIAYGDDFVNETYLYHLTRKDIRHNFSAYFYMLYLTVEDDDIGINLLTFLPQVNGIR